jgi:hypothetical protein
MGLISIAATLAPYFQTVCTRIRRGRLTAEAYEARQHISVLCWIRNRESCSMRTGSDVDNESWRNHASFECSRLLLSTLPHIKWLPETLSLWVEKVGMWRESLTSGFECRNKWSCNYTPLYVFMPIPLAAQSKAWLCCRLHAEIVGSNPARDLDVCLL